MRNAKQILPTLMTAVLLLSCSQEQPVQYTDEDAAETSTSAQKRRTFTWQAEVTDADSGSLALAADATAFSISLTDCVSTHTATVNQTKAYLELYEFDRNCLAKLTTFTLNGKVYTPKSGSEFDTWLTGDIATFEVNGAGTADELTVTIISTITNPVTAAGTIHYQFSEITAGGTETLGEAVVRESATLSVNGQASPNFSINQVKLVDITATGNGEFQFQLKCNNLVTGTGNNILCDDVLLNSISMTLTVDTYVGEPTNTDLENIFTAASGGVQIDMSTDAFVGGGGTPAMTNGGFITAPTGDADVMVLPGAKPIISYPNMILVLKTGSIAPYSYTYFYIDVTLISQSNNGP